MKFLLLVVPFFTMIVSNGECKVNRPLNSAPLVHKSIIYSKASADNAETFGVKFDNKTDDSDALQALLDNGGVINFPAGKTALIKKTLVISKNAVIVNGNLCTLNFIGDGAAIDFSRVNVKNFPVRISILDLSINVVKDGATGISWKSSYSILRNVSVGLNESNQTGIELCGDVNGSGSYYNVFESCFIQGAAHKGKVNDYGWKFTYDKSTPSRCPNANTWIGGRVGQCEIAMNINGNGNVVNHMTVEGSTTAFYFNNDDSKAGCVQNRVVMPYVESCKTAFKYGINSVGCLVSSPYMTTISSVKTDLGKNNVLNLNN